MQQADGRGHRRGGGGGVARSGRSNNARAGVIAHPEITSQRRNPCPRPTSRPSSPLLFCEGRKCEQINHSPRRKKIRLRLEPTRPNPFLSSNPSAKIGFPLRREARVRVPLLSSEAIWPPNADGKKKKVETSSLKPLPPPQFTPRFSPSPEPILLAGNVTAAPKRVSSITW